MEGYFNATKTKAEKRGRGNCSRKSKIEEFGSFIEFMELVDLPVVGNIYT